MSNEPHGSPSPEEKPIPPNPNMYESPVGDGGPPPSEGPVETNPEALQWAMFAHFGGILLGFLGPLIVWLVKKDEHPFVDDQGKEALNFQLTLLIVYLVVGAISAATCGFGSVLAIVPLVLAIVFGIIGGIEAQKGIRYRYPYIIRMVN